MPYDENAIFTAISLNDEASLMLLLSDPKYHLRSAEIHLAELLYDYPSSTIARMVRTVKDPGNKKFAISNAIVAKSYPVLHDLMKTGHYTITEDDVAIAKFYEFSLEGYELP